MGGGLPHELEYVAVRSAAEVASQALAAVEATAMSGIPAPEASWADVQAFMQQAVAEITGSGRAGWADVRRGAAVDRRCSAWQHGKNKEQQKLIAAFQIQLRTELG